MLPGRGEFPASRVLSILEAEGYGRFVSFEWEKRWHPQIEEPEVALPHFTGWVADVRLRAPERRPVPAKRSIRRGRLAVEIHPDRPAVGKAAAHSSRPTSAA